ncbi:Beta-phosphoglucomutase [Rhodovulum sp. PH10]|uniref:HAD family hydrolase n=1 Tax=Rhodovulum sp. PH10 TaxID=1187851 RepID=UPI00027C2D0B|nr:beta-phosphoglucomutase family hydrolase [Rhodovulum sp. PH10]EJW11105.1 Beta-phosphoglucomutase [Rhodovulum sp. PH10]
MQERPRLVVSRREFEAAVFDLDGVLTDTARIHAAVWKTVFDDFLRRRAAQEGVPFRPFDPAADYLAHVDGKPRLDGIRAFLGSRGISLPEGSPDDADDLDTVQNLARHKNRLVQGRLRTDATAEPGAAETMAAMRAAGIKVAVASSSANCAAVLEATGLDGLVDVRVDGIDAARLRLAGKPDPALFLEALDRLGVSPEKAVLFEDAIAGVAAGRRAGFCRVVGVDRGDHEEALRAHGADVVIANLAAVSVDPAT